MQKSIFSVPNRLLLNAAEAKEILDAVEKAGLFNGYLEDLVYTPKTLKAIEMVKGGSLGRILWTRSREAHPGPHSAWFWDKKLSGGGALVDMGCHCIEIGRSFIGKDIKPVEVMCWADTQVKPIEAEDHAIALIKYENGAVSQVEVSWNFRGGMDLRDEVSGTEGTIRLDHWLRTGFEVFTTGRQINMYRKKLKAITAGFSRWEMKFMPWDILICLLICSIHSSKTNAAGKHFMMVML